jgi:polar amino acid transport system permease protein
LRRTTHRVVVGAGNDSIVRGSPSGPITIAGLIFLAASYPTSLLMRRLEIRLGHY